MRNDVYGNRLNVINNGLACSVLFLSTLGLLPALRNTIEHSTGSRALKSFCALQTTLSYPKQHWARWTIVYCFNNIWPQILSNTTKFPPHFFSGKKWPREGVEFWTRNLVSAQGDSNSLSWYLHWMKPRAAEQIPSWQEIKGISCSDFYSSYQVGRMEKVSIFEPERRESNYI